MRLAVLRQERLADAYDKAPGGKVVREAVGRDESGKSSVSQVPPRTDVPQRVGGGLAPVAAVDSARQRQQHRVERKVHLNPPVSSGITFFPPMPIELEEKRLADIEDANDDDDEAASDGSSCSSRPWSEIRWLPSIPLFPRTTKSKARVEDKVVEVRTGRWAAQALARGGKAGSGKAAMGVQRGKQEVRRVVSTVRWETSAVESS
jgi:hypothetical protein